MRDDLIAYGFAAKVSARKVQTCNNIYKPLAYITYFRTHLASKGVGGSLISLVSDTIKALKFCLDKIS